jgi:colanic acid/amylovoran biosynthesis glycosyltransferase
MLPVANQLGVPLITTFRGYDVSRRFRQRQYVRAVKRLFERGTLFLTVCGAIKERLVALGAPENRIIIHYNGTPLDLFRPKHHTGRKQGPVRFLQVGRYTEKKGVPEIVDAFSRVIAAGIDAKLVLVGGGRTMADTKKKILLHGLSDRVVLKGVLPVTGVAKEMKQADIFVQNSMTAGNGDLEGLPNTVIEAMATALPVIASRHMGVPEAVEHGGSGILFDERDFDALTDAMISLANAPEKWEKMGIRGRQIVEKLFDLEGQNERLERIYDWVNQ